MALTPSTKIALGWAGLIAVGLSSFIWARDSVSQNRRVLMETRARIVEQARREGEEEFRRRSSERKANSVT
ncbi:hypothetical protein PoB_002621800 [Plakobranchus ocellatus]|uniref:Uncharacterized protein n=1 Tax=Plakobranchus ocellatus TaxID=259542 RepID=A0AAV3ZZ96_9GAST|nr:hypothetical protein PoB_002621800 [Plakobranchus ocellatus]